MTCALDDWMNGCLDNWVQRQRDAGPDWGSAPVSGAFFGVSPKTPVFLVRARARRTAAGAGRFAPIENLSPMLPCKKPNEFDKIKVDQDESR